MSATEPRPQRADARRNRERIVEAAREQFAELGMAAQMDDIARAARVGVGTVYRHFPTKDVLLGELLRQKFVHHADAARRWNETEDGWTAFEGFLREAFGEMTGDATMQRVMWVTSEGAREHAEEARLALSAVVDEMIRRAQAQGTLRADFTVAHMPGLMCSIGGVMSAEIPYVVEAADTLIEIVIDGLRAR
jgi:AcrR family transcriptional regulator